MNAELSQISSCLERIAALCTNPNWDSGRKNRIVELSNLASAQVANLQCQVKQLEDRVGSVVALVCPGKNFADPVMSALGDAVHGRVRRDR